MRKATVPVVSGTAPTFPSSTITFNAVVGQPANFANAASGTTPITYSASGSTGIFAVNSSTGAITSTSNPTSSADAVMFMVTATNGTLPNATRTVTINVTLTPGPTITLTILGVAPAITADPANATANAGGTATFTAAATGSPTPTFRWQRQASGTSGFVDLT
ncbi:MAG: hypothetical protein ACREH8_06785, partial [Opitutaceae bacterium]